MTEPLEAARAAVQRCDENQVNGKWAGETMELRTALRALIQHAENQQAQIDALQVRAVDLDARTIGSQVLG